MLLKLFTVKDKGCFIPSVADQRFCKNIIEINYQEKSSCTWMSQPMPNCCKTFLMLTLNFCTVWSWIWTKQLINQHLAVGYTLISVDLHKSLSSLDFVTSLVCSGLERVTAWQLPTLSYCMFPCCPPSPTRHFVMSPFVSSLIIPQWVCFVPLKILTDAEAFPWRMCTKLEGV